jgi:hypothetical protein
MENDEMEEETEVMENGIEKFYKKEFEKDYINKSLEYYTKHVNKILENEITKNEYLINIDNIIENELKRFYFLPHSTKNKVLFLNNFRLLKIF